MKVTIIAGYYPPEKSADTRLNDELAKGFGELGAEVTVVVPFPSRGLSIEQQKNYQNRREEQISSRVRVIRVGGRKPYSKGLLCRAIHYISNAYQMFKYAKRTPTDVYFIVSTPPFLGYVAAILGKKKPVVYKLQDVFPDSLMLAKNLNKRGPFLALLRQLEKRVYKNVAQINVVSEDIAKTLELKGVSRRKISVVYDWVDIEKSYEVSRESNLLFERFCLSHDKFYVCYAGNIGYLQNVSTLVYAADIVVKQRDIEFIIIGDGIQAKELDALIAQNGRDKYIHRYPWQSENEIASIYSIGDIGIVTIKKGVTNIALPSKTWNILAARRPVVCEIDRDSVLSTIIEEVNCGFSVEPGNYNRLAEAIIYLHDNKDLREEMATRGRVYVENELRSKLSIKAHFQTVVDRC